ncbi:interferon beta-like [Clupea harengus]|uniref:Interferon beta-like n=1 Tax=Clupea harengus TaxID=7950 RepID=A0A6P8FMQ2_CLUHA|nr:interferon beta-like [Clupea harengus]
MVCLFQGGSFPFECLDQNVQLTFPASAFESNGTAQVNVGLKKAIYDALRKIDVLFENDTMPNSWDQKKIDDFRNIVYRLVEENECGLNSYQAIEDDFSDREILLDAYFKEMADLLLQKEFSACAWEVVRKETLRTLGFILQNASDHLFWTRRHGHKRRR